MSQDQQTANSDISLKEVLSKLGEWWRYLLSKWLVIVVVGLLGAAVGLMLSIYKKPLYSAQTTFALEETGGMGGGLSQYAGVASMMGIDLGGASGAGLFSGENILELYKSRRMLSKALLTEADFNGKKQLLVERYIDSYKLREGWVGKPGLENMHFSSQGPRTIRQDSVLNEIVKEINKEVLTVKKPDKNLSILFVETVSIDELFAKTFNELIVKNVNDFYVQTKTKKALNNLKVLEHQTDSVRRELNAAISGVASSIDVNPNANPARQILRVPSQRRQVDAEANKGILVELVKSLEMSRVALRKETPLIQVIDEPILPLEKKRLGKAKGMIIGGIFGGFLIVLALLSRKMFREITA